MKTRIGIKIEKQMDKMSRELMDADADIEVLIDDQMKLGEQANPARLAVLQRVQGCIQNAAVRLGVDGILRGDVEYIIDLVDDDRTPGETPAARIGSKMLTDKQG